MYITIGSIVMWAEQWEDIEPNLLVGVVLEKHNGWTMVRMCQPESSQDVTVSLAALSLVDDDNLNLNTQVGRQLKVEQGKATNKMAKDRFMSVYGFWR